MDPQEPIPLQDAVQRDLIPCSVCGAKGADVHQVEGKKHFLCAACAARGRRWTLGVLAAAIAVVAVIVGVRMSGSTDPASSSVPPPTQAALNESLATIGQLLQKREFEKAQGLLIPLIDQAPNVPILNLFMGRCCYNLGQYETSLRAWQIAATDPANEEECRFRIGEALQQLGHSGRAKPYFDKPFTQPSFQTASKPLLVALLTDLEEFDQALRLLDTLPPDPGARFYRHRALLYQGKPDEARKAFDGADDQGPDLVYRTQALALQAREEGDFATAFKLVEQTLAKLDPASVDAYRVRRIRLAVHSEAGDRASVEKDVEELLATGDPRMQGEALWYRAMARLADGKRDLALADAREILQRPERRKSWLRLEVQTMEHLVGLIKDEDLEREARAVNRFRANDVYYYLALATGKKEWAEKALASTPGHNSPYHAIQRLLKGK